MTFEITVIGEIYMDHIFSQFTTWPQPGEEVFTDHYTWELGGGAVTTACALARLGRSVQLIGVIGAADASLIGARLQHFGVSTQGLSRSNGKSGVTVSVSTLEDRSFFTFRGVNQELTHRLRSDADLLSRASDSRHIHIAMPLDVSTAAAVLPALTRHGATTSLDVGYHVDWLRDPASLEVLRNVDYFLPNEKEADTLCGDARQYLAFCKQLGLKHAVIKLGSAGAAILSHGEEFHANPPDIPTVDTTGAGDAFNAGFLDALLHHASPKQCIQHGCSCGALSTRSAGALASLPSRPEADAVFEEHYVT